MHATPLTYKHEPRRFFWVVRDLGPDPRYFLGIEVASRAQLPRCAPTGGPSYVPTALRSAWEWILASPARVCRYLMAKYLVGKCDGRLPGRPAAAAVATLFVHCGPQPVLRLLQCKKRWGSTPQWACLRAPRQRVPREPQRARSASRARRLCVVGCVHVSCVREAAVVSRLLRALCVESCLGPGCS